MNAKVNDRFSYSLSGNTDIEVVERAGSRYRIWYNGDVSEIEVLNYDIRTKYFEVAIDGFVFKINLEDELDEVIRMIWQKSEEASGNIVVSAPIPGLIKSLSKKDGDSVGKGESVLVLEAMKMENTIQAPHAAGQINYHVETGGHVSKGQKLFTLK